MDIATATQIFGDEIAQAVVRFEGILDGLEQSRRASHERANLVEQERGRLFAQMQIIESRWLNTNSLKVADLLAAVLEQWIMVEQSDGAVCSHHGIYTRTGPLAVRVIVDAPTAATIVFDKDERWNADKATNKFTEADVVTLRDIVHCSQGIVIQNAWNGVDCCTASFRVKTPENKAYKLIENYGKAPNVFGIPKDLYDLAKLPEGWH